MVEIRTKNENVIQYIKYILKILEFASDGFVD